MQTITDNLVKELNDEQKKAVKRPVDSFTKVVAGAGTGKTKIISKRYIKLVLDLQAQGVEKPLEHILVITFTNKAANEMKERIYKELRENNIDFYGQEAKISTIHSFCLQMLKKHSLETNLSPDFKTEDEVNLEKIFQNIIKKIKCGEYKQIKYLQEVAEELKIDSEILSADNLVEFVNIQNLDSTFATIFSIMKKIKSLGFTPKEMIEKSDAIKAFSHAVSKIEKIDFDEKMQASKGGNREYFNSFLRILDGYISSSLKNLDDKDDIKDVLEPIFKEKNIIDKDGERFCCKWKLAENYKENIANITEIELKINEIIALIYGVYQKQLEELDIVDFDDYINKVLFILKNNELIRNYYKKYFKHIIVDEFQDTNGAQLDVLYNLLSDESPNITIVGDKKQSIYAFRYAKMDNMDTLHKRIKANYKNYLESDNDIEIKLTKNYRSTEKVLRVVNLLTKNDLNLNEELEKGNLGLSEDDSEVKVSLFEEKLSKDKNAVLKYIAKTILEKTNSKTLQYKDFAVLISKNYMADEIEDALKKYGIPSVKAVNNAYFKNPVVLNIIALMHFAQNVRNEQALIQILSLKYLDKEIYDIVKKINEELKQSSEINKNTLREMNLSEKIVELISQDKFENVKTSDNENIFNDIKILFEETLKIAENKKNNTIINVFKRLVSLFKPYNNLTGFAEKMAENDIMIFEKIILDYMKQVNYTSLKDFNEYIVSASEDKNFELPSISMEDINAVQLVTIHKSKGLEYPYVFVYTIPVRNKADDYKFDYEYNDVNGKFGLVLTSVDNVKSPKSTLYKNLYKTPQEIAEKNRVFYVALTRAVKYLDIIDIYKDGDFDKKAETEEISETEGKGNKAKKSKETTKNTKTGYFNNLKFSNTELLQSIITCYAKEEDVVLDEKLISDSFDLYEKTENNTVSLEAPVLPEKKETKNVISFSKINSYNNCKRNFLLKYCFGYPEHYENINGNKLGSMMLGSIVHNLIYHSFVQQKTFEEVEIDRFIKDFELEEKDITKIKSLYNAYKESSYSKYNSENFAEYGFNYDYNKNTVFKGDIDLLIKNNDETYTIIDFKTNENLSEKDIDGYSNQMYIYKSAMEQENKTIKDMVIVNLTTKGIVEHSITKEQLSNAKKYVSETLKEIELSKGKPISDIEKLQEKNTCFTCGYRYLCK